MVWWDMSDCPLPTRYDPCLVRTTIEGTLMKLGYSGPLSISAYGDLKETSEYVLGLLSYTGVDLHHTVVKEVRCSLMYSDMLKWRELNPPPATMMLISDQVEAVFSYNLCRLQQQEPGYNIVLAYSYRTDKYSFLHHSAMFLWERLLKDLETPRLRVTGKSAMFHCRSCHFVFQSFENFTKHLSGEEHAQEETRISQSTRPSLGLDYEQSKVMAMRKNYSPAPEFATSKTVVLWDMSDCPVPVDYDACRVRPSIEGALKKLGYSGPVSITAYGDLKHTPEHVLRGLSSTGVHLQHTIEGKRCTLMSSDLWKVTRPATIMLISNQVGSLFVYSLCKLQQQKDRFNIVLAYTYASTKASFLFTTAEWLWENLLLTDSERPRWVIRKCSETVESAMLQCRSCSFVGQSLENFTKHLWSEEHEQREIWLTRPRSEYSKDSKRVRKAFRMGFRLGNYLRLTYRLRKKRNCSRS